MLPCTYCSRGFTEDLCLRAQDFFAQELALVGYFVQLVVFHVKVPRGPTTRALDHAAGVLAASEASLHLLDLNSRAWCELSAAVRTRRRFRRSSAAQHPLAL